MTKPILNIIEENERRKALLFAHYDPVMGEGSPLRRFPFFVTSQQSRPVMLPISMISLPEIVQVMEAEARSAENYAIDNGLDPEVFTSAINEARFDHDFEFWAAMTVKIKPKEGGKHIPFVLNGPQRKLLATLEAMRHEGVPIRVIILKARQWGGSTLVQIYMAWIQIRHKTNWNSLIAAHINQAATNIRSMYKTLAQYYPLDKIALSPFEGTQNIKIIRKRDNKITIGSMQTPESIRSDDIAMAHLSEVGLWIKTKGKKPEDLIQSILGTIPALPLSMVVMESTAKGVGNFFHQTWLDAKKKGTYRPVFVAWFEIQTYFMPFKDELEKAQLIATMDEYELYLWSIGATLEGIKWYRFKKGEYRNNTVSIASEFPSDEIEAFQSSGARFFSVSTIQKARRYNRPPLFVGDVFADALRGPESLKNIKIEPENQGRLSVWSMPETFTDVKYTNRYVVSVDIGGRSKEADDSVIKVYDRFWLMEGGILELAACWAGKIDFDHLAWKAVQICKLYDNAFMVPEINKMRENSNTDDFDEGDQFYTLIDEVLEFYDNIFCRTTPEQVRQGLPKAWGFHTNRQTKPMILNTLNAAYRDDQVANYDVRSMDQADSFEIKGNGSTGAVEGAHDDHVIADGIGVWAALKHMPPVVEVKINAERSIKRRKLNEASFN